MPVLAARRVRRMSSLPNSEANVARDRELINPQGDDKRYVRRNEQGEFTDSQDDVGRSLRQDRRTDAEHEVNKGQGDRGDQAE